MKKVETLNNMLVYENSYSIKFINDYLNKNNLTGLRIYSPFEDNRIDDFSFLSKIENLQELSIFYFEAIDFGFLYNLEKLKKLSIQTLFSEINFSKLPALDSLSIQWNKKYIKNIDSLLNLSILLVNGFDEKDFIQLKSLVSLRFLSIKNSKCITLLGIESLYNLEGLYIGGFKNLNDVSNLSSLRKIKFIFFELCPKIEDLNALREVCSIEILEVLDCKKIKTISFVNELSNLKQLSLLGSTQVEDFDSLETKNIEILSIDHKKYNVAAADKFNLGKRKSFLNLIDEHSN